jgi:hypothetical protein
LPGVLPLKNSGKPRFSNVCIWVHENQSAK